MKKFIPRTPFLLIASLLCAAVAFATETNSVAPIVTGPAVSGSETSAPVSPTPAPAASTQSAPANLPYGVDDILKLSQAQVHDDVILNYIQSVPTVYNLNPKDIVYLRNEGVSDAVINSMLDQRKKALQTPSVPTTPEAPAPEVADASAYYPPPVPVPVPVPAPVAVYPDPFMAAQFPICAPLYLPYEDPTASTLYVIPDHNVRAAYYGGGLRTYYGGFRGGYRSSLITIGRHGGGVRTYHRGGFRR